MKNKINSICVALLFMMPFFGSSQGITGIVYEYGQHGEKTPLPGVNVYWSGTTSGTATGSDGKFAIDPYSEENHFLVASFIGYLNDTIHVHEREGFMEIVLTPGLSLDEVVVSERQKSTYISQIDPVYVQNISNHELFRAACCNLSESFETNASVDVSYSDAVTGAKRIDLLGLHGKYTQMMTENIQNLRGLSSTFGLGYIPGSWMESIQISKGTSSVVNGYESVTGQINVEYKKPDKSERLYLNMYGNSIGKLEGNANASVRLNDKLSTMVFLHAEDFANKIDHNHDGFLDHPLMWQYNFSNRWKYESGYHSAQLGFNVIDERRNGGQTEFNSAESPLNQPYYGIEINTRRYEIWGKTGYIFPESPHSSIGFVNSLTLFDQDSYYGLNNYTGDELTYYGNLIFQSEMGSERHKYSAGAGFMYDETDEVLADSAFSRIEKVPGLFFQYTYSNEKNLTLLLGMRADFHNFYGTFYTPRLHLKYNAAASTVIRASAGKGYRTANVIAENNYLLASSRQLSVLESPRQEEAWNYGLNVLRHFDLLGREFNISLEFYRTDFVNQLVVDRDRSFDRLYVYNLNGRSFSNSYQAELSWEVIPRLDATLAFRVNDVRMTTNSELQREPLVNKYKGLVSLSYKTAPPRWQFDLTGQINGSARIPSTEELPEKYRRDENSPEYVIINVQVNRFFKNWSVYTGVENLTGFVQDDPVIASDDPFGPYFDSSMIWGPLTGRKIYAGLRYTIE
ncbi:MAG: TonB-dependent receptor [Bacteroidales bacterium]|nr:TonB-dependent receptor [Bacteroidales bacterium]